MSALCEASSRFSGHSLSAIRHACKVVFSPFSTLQRNNCCSESSTVRNFDICLSGSKSFARLEPSSDRARNCEIWNGAEKKFERVSQVRAMRPGMVLLKHYITYDEQVGIIRSCQKLGLGPGGFYQLGNHGHYIMALGLTWDPKRRMYELWRTVDGTKTHDIPEDYSLLVKRSIQDAHAHLKKDLKGTNLEVEDVLPSMSPTVCIVNFYTTLATLALHQNSSLWMCTR
ncbi:uncharacterized protein LOC107410574 [Ziziphus jujuba]|uniref:Uncharacterized protein LOC107410574 n=1 Tax=Ziziphus jujuba TaxID=326968 RepID=A0ABM3IB43_ZIZJJ|nr:uncharacterized protein LOC107410574 [Ziziphus jujuba]